MTRYYYTDPLAAAWMAEKHGIKICLRDDYSPTKLATDETGKVIDYTLEVMDSDPRWREGCKFYVHPDSERLLVPQDGDVVELWGYDQDYSNIGGDYAEYHADYQLEGPVAVSLNNIAMLIEGRGGVSRIIQRNGLAFMRPEKEEV